MAESKDNGDKPLDINGNNFDPDKYLDCILKHATLKQIMDKEAEVVTQSQFLQSEMQTLVYENYNKFISATETVRKMRTDFEIMQREMNKLSENMDRITGFSAQISGALSASGGAVGRLCGARALLDRLTFLFQLPARLRRALADGRLGAAVRDHARARRVLRRCGDAPSFRGIRAECDDLARQLRATLRARLAAAGAASDPDPAAGAASELAESAALLRAMGEPAAELRAQFERCAEARLERHVRALEAAARAADVLAWAEACADSMLADLAALAACHRELFPGERSSLGVEPLVRALALFEEVASRPENDGTDVLVRGLDRLFRRLQAMADVVFDDAVPERAADVVVRCVERKAAAQSRAVLAQFKDGLTRVRRTLASRGAEPPDLRDPLDSLRVSLTQKIRAALQDLMAFLESDLSFGLKPWCARAVADGCRSIVSDTMASLAELVREVADPRPANSAPAELPLVLARLCLDLRDGGEAELLEPLARLPAGAGAGPRAGAPLAGAAQAALAGAAQAALDAHVARAGRGAAQMLRVSVLARDWLRAPEPRGPRAACRRVAEALAAADAAAAQLFPASPRPSSDGSRRAAWAPPGRLFAERIEVFGPAGASRAALAEAAARVALKALAECVRLRTFGRHGLQQVQVDAAFLLARLAGAAGAGAGGERPLAALLDDALAAATLRCLDPRLMEPSLVDILCERG